jgi:hypothetical protein
MDDFESPSLESSDGITPGAEKTREQSEKQRESYKKAQVQIQKAQKDEKKARWDNDQLFLILERFIQNPYYEELIPLITWLLQKAVPSRYILTLIALFYPEATIHILTQIKKEEDITLLLSLHRYDGETEFDESTLHPTIRTWMSTWVHAGQLYITDTEMSRIMQQKLSKAITEDIYLTEALALCLQFFFTSRHLKASSRIMTRYAEHIISEYQKALRKSLETGDQTMFSDDAPSDHAFFGIETDPHDRVG